MRIACRERGFSLMELMIVVAIVGILFAVALPSYRAYAIRTYRTTAEADLVQLSHIMERRYTAVGRYDDADNPGSFELLFNTSPQEEPDPAYNLSFKIVDSTSFVLQAQPTGDPGKGQAQDTKCGTISIDQTGVKCILDESQCSNGDDTAKAAVQDCW